MDEANAMDTGNLPPGLDEVVAALREQGSPEDFFAGHMLPDEFALPDNILMFYQDWHNFNVYRHSRYVLMITLEEFSSCVDGVVYNMPPGSAILKYPFQERYAVRMYESYSRIFISFDLPEVQNYLPGCHVVPLSPAAWRYVRDLATAYSGGEDVRCALRLCELLTELSHYRPERVKRHLPRQITAALALLKEDATNAIHVGELAAKLKMSESHLRLLFREHTGESIGSFMLKLRLAAAKGRLLRSDMPIAEIAASCGYASVYAFSHFFHRQCGMSPVAFRRKFGHADSGNGKNAP